MPDFAMPDQDGRIVRLTELIADGPTILAIHRGHWCPYCRLNMVGLADIQDKRGYRKNYAISAKKQGHNRAQQAASGTRFPFLTHFQASTILRTNLPIDVPDIDIPL